jgi:hypothetical protein
MNRIVTSALGMLVIAGVLYRPAATDVGLTPETQSLLISRGTETHQQRGSRAQPEEVLGKQARSTIGSNPCFDTSGPWDKIPQFFGGEAEKNELGALDPFKKSLDAASTIRGAERYELQYMIATLADPVHTNLQLYFDRGIEAIVRAAAASGYDFDSYWLPWSSEALPEEPNCYWRGLRDSSTDKKERMPGLLLFRKSDPAQLLFVFLVSETPTSGIEKEQLLNAVRYFKDIRGGRVSAGDVIPVLGPTFSGSVDSLILAINAAKQQLDAGLRFRVSSGSITNRAAIDRLRAHKEVPAGTTLEDDPESLAGFVCFLGSQGTQPAEVALITEDGTAYGEAVAPHAERDQQSKAQQVLSEVIELHFPRKLASLRQAYQANPQVGASGTAQQPSLPRTLLPLSLAESARSEEDAVPVFSKQQTPIAQESQVIALAATLREKNIKYAGILATDPLDVMFLIRILHRSAPDVRLFVVDADLLFLRALEDNTAPVGLLAITSYPTLPASRAWLSGGSGAGAEHLVVFTNEYAEATYNSCALLLNKNKAKAPVRDASAVSSQPHQVPDLSLNPPLWLMMAGHSGYWPVRLLEDGGLAFHLDKEKLPHAWVLIWVLVSCLALCHALAVIFAHCVNWRCLEPFRLSGMGTPLRVAEQASYLLVATLAVLAIEGLLLYAPWGLELLAPLQLGFASLVTGLLLVVTASLLLVVGAAGLRSLVMVFFRTRFSRSPSWHLPGPFSSLAEREKKGLWYVLLAAFVVAALYRIKPWSWGGVEPYVPFFWYRSIHLTSGVSPVVPFCFLVGALYAWAWTHLKRLATAAHQPLLWPSKLLQPFIDAEAKVQSGMQDLLYHHKLTLLVFALTLFAILALGLHRHFATPESSLFSGVYTGGLTLLLLLVFINWARFLVIWLHFRRVLEGMDQLPLRAALRRLPKQYSWSPIWEHGGTRPSYEILIRWFDNLQKLASVTGSKKLQEYYEKNWSILRQIASQLKREGIPAPSLRDLQAGLLETTRFVEETYLRSEWSKGKSDSLAKEAESSLTEQARQQEFEANKNRILAEESLALYYARYIRNVCLYMRYVLFFISAGFIFALISLKSYPFQPEHTISLAITAVFAVLAIGVIWVFVEMEKDPVLSCLADTQEGKLSGAFYLRLVSYGALPLFTFIAAQFPSVARFFFSWIQPSLNAFK